MVDILNPAEQPTHAPNYDLQINGASINAALRRMIGRVEFESTDGMADLLKITVSSPYKNDESVLIDKPVFQVGNEISLFGGYGTRVVHIGRGVVRRSRTTFANGGVPQITVVCYSRDALMSDNSPLPNKEREKDGGGKKSKKGGRAFYNTTYADAIRQRAQDYDFAVDVDPTKDSPSDFVQKVGLTDYNFIQGLSNITGYYFWVDASQNGLWTLHFKDPDKLDAEAVGQAKKYVFKYNQSNLSTLLSFAPEIALQGSPTKLKVITKDVETGATLEVVLEEKDLEGNPVPEVIQEGPQKDATLQLRIPTTAEPAIQFDPTLGQTEQLTLERNIVGHSTAAAVKLYINDFSFAIQAARTFRNEKELAEWARQWFQRHREAFISGTGTLIGVESLRARQTHTLKGLAKSLDGDYQFTRVRHVFDSSGYLCEFSAHKVVGVLEPSAGTITAPIGSNI